MCKTGIFINHLGQERISFGFPVPRAGTMMSLSCDTGEKNQGIHENQVLHRASAKSLHVCPTLCNTMDYSLQGSSVRGILQVRILEWVPVPFPRWEYWNGFPCPPPGDLPNPGIESVSPKSLALAGGFFITSTTWEAQILHSNSAVFTIGLPKPSSVHF